MRKILFLLAVAVLAAACSQAVPEGTLKHVSPESMGMNSQKLNQIDREVALAIEEGNIPGCVVSVVRGDKIVFLKAYGNKQVVPDTVPMTPETIFDLASVSKCVGTTLSFMQLVENGYVRLSDDVDMYIPDFKPWVDPETGRKVDITVQDVMTHTSGLAPYIATNAYLERFGVNSPDSLIWHIANEIKRNFRPKTGYMYSCLNFVTVQNILQNITGEKLCDYAEKNVFGKLGLQHTGYMPKERHPEWMPMIAPTELQDDGTCLLGEVHDPLARLANGGNSGNAGVFSNAVDLSRICMMVMNQGIARKDKKLGFYEEDTRVLSPSTVRVMTTIPPENAPSVGRALGWDVKSEHSGLRGDLFNPEKTLMHTGYTGTSLVIDLNTRTAIILLTNRVHPMDDGSVSRLRALVSNIVAGAIRY